MPVERRGQAIAIWLGSTGVGSNRHQEEPDVQWKAAAFMNKFRKLGFIEYNGKLEVHNSLLNVVLHDKPEIKTRDEAISAE
jgi:hypothetical protein